MIIKTEDFEIEIYNGIDVYFASKKLGQNFKKWDDFDDSEKHALEIMQKKVERLTLEYKEILSETVIANTLNRDRRSGSERRQYLYYQHLPERRSEKERRSEPDRRLKQRTLNS
jgi:hypothetical protein